MKRLVVKGAALGMALLVSSPQVLASDYTKHWAKEAIEKWNTYGIVKGYENGDFKPNNSITRAELATILDRVFKFPETSILSPYMDIIAVPDKWYVAPVSKVTAQELMYIEGFLFEPNAPVTREEAAYAIAKAYELTPVEEVKTYFKDEAQISLWAKEAVKTLAYYGYISGTPEGNFMPQSTLTRAEIVTMLNNMTSKLITKSETFNESIKGNVVVSSSEVVLKDLTIEGNLYITSGVTKITLDHVTVTGTVYVNGGSVQMSGTYKEVRLATGAPIELTAGTIEKLVVNKAGSSLKVTQGAVLGEVIQKSPIQIEGQGTVAGQIGVGGLGNTSGGQVGQSQAPKLQSVEMTISGTAVALPVSDQSIIIDLPALSSSFSASATIDSFKILANTPNATITSDRGKIKAGSTYTFRELEEQLGLIREVAVEVGISPDLIVEQLLGEDKITLGGLLDNYALGKALAGSLGYHLENSYTFKRYLMSSQGKGETIYITLRLQ